MKVIEYFSSEKQDIWLKQIEKCDWGAGKWLAELLRNNGLFDLIGDGARVLMLTEGEELISFSTLAPLDDVQPTDLTPWMGWIYTFPSHRGKRCLGELFAYAGKIARAEGHSAIHISTNHIGLYEKYGFEFYKNEKDIGGEDTRVYIKRLSKDK